MRMTQKTPKQLLLLEGKELLAYSLDLFESCPLIHRICIVTAEPWLEDVKRIVRARTYTTRIDLVEGGSERHYSCQNALGYYGREGMGRCNIIFHDAARPLLRAALLHRVCEALAQFQAVTPILPCNDTVWMVEKDSRKLASPLDRSKLGCAQTPQGFRIELLQAAYEWYDRQGAARPLPTDTCGLVQMAYPGIPIAYVEGCHENIKITNAIDLTIARSILKCRKKS